VKQENFGSKTKLKYAVLISLWSEAKNLKQKEVKKTNFFFRMLMRNACETDLVLI
jgi:L-ribulose-5-phosphate 3-epimerase UlaE